MPFPLHNRRAIIMSINQFPEYYDYLTRILTSSVYDVAIETPLDFAVNLSRRLNNKIYLKREDLQPVFSFKIRGAYNKMAKLPPELLKKGVITASAGNHAQGVALSAQKLGCSATIVMPETTPNIKIDAVKARGGNVVLAGVSYNDAYDHAMKLVAESGLTYIPPFDDPDVIAGQGTIGMEIVRQHAKPIDAVFVAIGGGGTAVKLVGEETFRMCRDLLDDIITVDTDAVCGALKDVFDDTRSICEPSGALALAGLKAYIARNHCENAVLVAITSGANMNFHRLRHVSERSELSEGNEAIFAVSIPERAGSFRAFVNTLGARNITEFNYRYGDDDVAHIFVGIQTAGAADREHIRSELNAAQLPNIDLSNDEMAKVHLRYMVGGRTHKVQNERVISFEFPERPKALAKFLNAMQTDWNITLFHYRNHGADYGRILVGIDVPDSDEAAFNAFLENLGYAYEVQTDNAAYKLFLSAA